jgi:hypothetical protein
MTTPMGKGLRFLRRYLRWSNGNKITKEYWDTLITELEQDATREYAHNLLHEMYAFEGEHFNFLMKRLHEEAGE